MTTSWQGTRASMILLPCLSLPPSDLCRPLTEGEGEGQSPQILCSHRLRRQSQSGCELIQAD